MTIDFTGLCRIIQDDVLEFNLLFHQKKYETARYRQVPLVFLIHDSDANDSFVSQHWVKSCKVKRMKHLVRFIR
jgi:uncharacterized protein YegL